MNMAPHKWGTIAPPSLGQHETGITFSQLQSIETFVALTFVLDVPTTIPEIFTSF